MHEPRVQLIAEEWDVLRFVDAEEERGGRGPDAFECLGEDGESGLWVHGGLVGRLGGERGEGGLGGGCNQFGGVLADQGGEEGAVGAVGSG